MEPIRNWFTELKLAQQLEEIIISMKGMQIAKTWHNKTTWPQDIESAKHRILYLIILILVGKKQATNYC